MSHAVARSLHHIIPGCITYCLGPRHSKLHITCKPHLLWEQVATKLMGKEVHVLVVCTNDRLERQKRVTAHHPTSPHKDLILWQDTVHCPHSHIIHSTSHKYSTRRCMGDVFDYHGNTLCTHSEFPSSVVRLEVLCFQYKHTSRPQLAVHLSEAPLQACISPIEVQPFRKAEG